jgi:hypothetical protein
VCGITERNWNLLSREKNVILKKANPGVSPGG